MSEFNNYFTNDEPMDGVAVKTDNTALFKEWATEMIDREIEEMEETIDNELFWAAGSDTPELHNENIEMYKEYIEFLKELLK